MRQLYTGMICRTSALLVCLLIFAAFLKGRISNGIERAVAGVMLNAKHINVCDVSKYVHNKFTVVDFSDLPVYERNAACHKGVSIIWSQHHTQRGRMRRNPFQLNESIYIQRVITGSDAAIMYSNVKRRRLPGVSNNSVSIEFINPVLIRLERRNPLT